jgi:hypothetical protein
MTKRGQVTEALCFAIGPWVVKRSSFNRFVVFQDKPRVNRTRKPLWRQGCGPIYSEASGEAKRSRLLLNKRITKMIKIQITRSLLSITTMVTLWLVPVMSQATELQSLVVTGIALDKVTVSHPTPE